jgi:hypothetical protein
MRTPLDKLQKLELALMREAFEIACRKADLPTNGINLDAYSPHAQLASVIQMLVEQGITDPKFISDYAVATLRTEAASSGASKDKDDPGRAVPISKLFL